MIKSSSGSIFVIRETNLEVYSLPHAWHPPTDLYETDDGYTVRVEIAGVEGKDILIQHSNNLLKISGRRPLPNARCAYHRMEVSFGEFSSAVQLPQDADLDSAAAEYDQGFLNIQIPKAGSQNIKNMDNKED